MAHYAATGEVRRRFPFSGDVQFYLEGAEQGSFSFRVKLLAGTIAVGIATNAIYDLGKLVISRAIGEEPASLSHDIQGLEERKGGDIEALIEAVEPSLKKAHYGIGETAEKIEIYEEYSRRTVITFDADSKLYINTSQHAGDDAQDVSISALNVNNRTGRAYFPDLKRTVPFSVSRDARPETMTALSTALDRYAKKKVVPLRLYFTRIEAADGRLKRVIVFGAEDISEAD